MKRKKEKISYVPTLIIPNEMRTFKISTIVFEGRNYLAVLCQNGYRGLVSVDKNVIDFFNEINKPFKEKGDKK